MMNRRDFFGVAGAGLAVASSLLKPVETAAADTIYINSSSGLDSNPGTRQQPLKTLGEAARRVNKSEGAGSTTIVLSEGLFVLDETALFKNNRRYTETERLTIRSELFPDDPGWRPDRMPVILPAMPLRKTWLGGRPDQFGENANGLQIEVSHATVQGLKVLGSPVFEYLDPQKIRRIYPIMREGTDLEDLLVTQCLFVGNHHASLNHVSVIANGNRLALDHCVFFNCKIPVVFWMAQGGISRGNAMRYCLVSGAYDPGACVWTTQTADDLEFHHNVLANSHCAWIRQAGLQRTYRVRDSVFANNQYIAGTGTGPLVNFKPADAVFLTMENSTISDKTVAIELDQSKKDYLHIVPGTFGADVGAGLFRSPRSEGK
jgi:hypothetical protein